jgi:hypothetical protein
MFRNAQLADLAKLVTGLAPITPSTTTPDYVSMKNYARCAIIILVDNATTVTGSAITLKQSTNVANSLSDEKAVAFTSVLANIDTAAGDTLAATAVTSNTFTTLTTNNKNCLYVIDVEASMLDVTNGFDCLRVGTADAANTVLSVLYVLYPARYASPIAVSAITD